MKNVSRITTIKQILVMINRHKQECNLFSEQANLQVKYDKGEVSKALYSSHFTFEENYPKVHQLGQPVK